MKTALQQKKQAFRDGVCFQSSTVAHLYEPGATRLLQPANPHFEAQAKRLTTPSMVGSWNGKSVAAMARAIVEQGLALARSSTQGKGELMAADVIGKRV